MGTPRILALSLLFVVSCSQAGRRPAPQESPLTSVPGFFSAAEAYLSPDGRSIVCNAIEKEGDTYHTWIVGVDGSNRRSTRIRTEPSSGGANCRRPCTRTRR